MYTYISQHELYNGIYACDIKEILCLYNNKNIAHQTKQQRTFRIYYAFPMFP